VPWLRSLLRWTNPVYWLLYWSPSRKQKQVLAFVVVGGLLAGVLVLTPALVGLDLPGDSATVEEIDVTVRLNDEFTPPEGSAETGVQRCIAVGTPPDSLGITGQVRVYAPDDAAVVVSLAHADESTVDPVEDAGSHESRVFWLLEDDESLSVGETATVQVRVRSGGETLAAANRTVPVKEGTQTYDC